MTRILEQLRSAELFVASFESTVMICSQSMFKMVPRVDVEQLHSQLQSARREAEAAAAREEAAVEKAESEQRGVIEALNRLLTDRQEECAQLLRRLHVRIFAVGWA